MRIMHGERETMHLNELFSALLSAFFEGPISEHWVGVLLHHCCLLLVVQRLSGNFIDFDDMCARFLILILSGTAALHCSLMKGTKSVACLVHDFHVGGFPASRSTD
jgi:hypothetical protein